MSDRTKWIIGIILGVWLVGVIARTIIASVAMKNGYLPKKNGSNTNASNLTQYANDQTATYNEQARNAAITRLYNTAQGCSDMFYGISAEQAPKFIKYGSKEEIDKFTDLMIKGEKNWTKNESDQFLSLWSKLTGKVVSEGSKGIPV